MKYTHWSVPQYSSEHVIITNMSNPNSNLLVIVLSVLLRFTDSGYPFGIFKLFFDRITTCTKYKPGFFFEEISVTSAVIVCVLFYPYVFSHTIEMTGFVFHFSVGEMFVCPRTLSIVSFSYYLLPSSTWDTLIKQHLTELFKASTYWPLPHKT